MSGFYDDMVLPGKFTKKGFNIFFEQYTDIIYRDRCSVAQEIFNSLMDRREDLDTIFGRGWNMSTNKQIFVRNYPT